MKLKKLFAMLMTCIMMLGMLGVFPTTDSANTNSVQSILESLSFDAEPMTVSAADGTCIHRAAHVDRAY